ncbi:glycoside hydrolase family 2 protein [Sphingomonas bacterium]|uniref:glycoside hydrolase family 2 protein n=1 Tax=Sphingomonas bacterium TaxID=1895847 RepID=UPI0015754D92|nr:glycoside hydrolase family 2 TIM barrel-domain containing protein [Sphingomonas bacterium]
MADTTGQAGSIETEKIMLSGHGPDDAVPWEFTIDGGRRAGEHATIPVPSNWQQQGFGTYKYGYESSTRPENRGHYRRHFVVPTTWKERRVRLVFDGAMTDTRVTVNGVQAGPIHQGGFTRFSFDVTKLVKVGGDNVVEVDVAEASANPDTNTAERAADYWIFGGIFRPVWLEATPEQAIAHAAVDARADGTLGVDVTLAAPRDVTRVEGQVTDGGGLVGAPFAAAIPPGGAGRVRLATRIATPRLWTAETPNLYALTLTLYRGDTVVHRTHERFGFRSFEVRSGQGLYLNGQRILLKGVNRHSFRPDTARTLTRADNEDDVRTIRSMNMNAVRMSHYPPDEAFLAAADELGLYVLDELTGWEHAHDTEVGRRLVREMVERDVNHPSIVLWDNGNEGGWNRELDGDFALYDPQARKVMHPWELHDGVDTKHYPTYPDVVRRLASPNLLMPTEFMHGLFDGGAGSGLEDYWNAIAGSPHGAGGFIWSFADEGVARTDQHGRIDEFATRAPDGILGARHEREPSYFTVRDLWSPVQVHAPVLDAGFGGALRVTNGYDFTSLDAATFDWVLLRFAKPGDATIAPRILHRGVAHASVAPHATGELLLALPADWRAGDALSLTARHGADELWTWVWPIQPATAPALPVARPRDAAAVAVRDGDTVRLVAGDVAARFDAATGLLRDVTRGGRRFALANGPRLVTIAPRSKVEPVWTPMAGDGVTFRPAAPTLANLVEVKLPFGPDDGWVGFTLKISADGITWRTIYSGERGKEDGERYVLTPGRIAAVRVTGAHGSSGVALAVASVRLGYEPGRFPPPRNTPVTVRSGLTSDPRTGSSQAWLEADGAGDIDHVRWTLAANGRLTLDYRYALSGAFLYHGVSFDYPLTDVAAVRALLDGPSPVWQNRLRGTRLGVYEIATRDGSAPSPERTGYLAGLRWARFATSFGSWSVASASPTYLRVGTRLNDASSTTIEFPGGDIGFLDAIPAMGSKFITPQDSGPAGMPAIAAGTHAGQLVFDWATATPRKRTRRASRPTSRANAAGR